MSGWEKGRLVEGGNVNEPQTLPPQLGALSKTRTYLVKGEESTTWVTVWKEGGENSETRQQPTSKWGNNILLGITGDKTKHFWLESKAKSKAKKGKCWIRGP